MNSSINILNKIFELNLSEKDCDLILKVAELLEMDSDNLHDSFVDCRGDSTVIDVINSMIYNADFDSAIEFNYESNQYKPIIDKNIVDLCKKLNCLISK